MSCFPRAVLLSSLLFATASSYVLQAPRVACRPAAHRAPVVFMEEDGPAPAAPEPASAEASTPPPPEPEPVEEEIDEGELAKEALKAEVADGLSGARPDKAVVGEILLALEARNPTRSPATSPLLNGKWKVMFASGASPGLKALTLLLSFENTAKLNSQLEAESAVRLRETYASAES